MNFENELKEIKHKQTVLKYLNKIGIDKDINRIISPDSKQPYLIFKFSDKLLFKRFLSLIKSETVKVFIERGGCVGFNPVNSGTDEELLNHFYVETKPLKYGCEELSLKCYIRGDKKRFYHLNVDLPLKWFEDSLTYEEVKDVYETEQARKYNFKHKDVFMNRPFFRDLEKVKFYGGNIYHYATCFKESELINELLKVK